MRNLISCHLAQFTIAEMYFMFVHNHSLARPYTFQEFLNACAILLQLPPLLSSISGSKYMCDETTQVKRINPFIS